MQKYISAFIFLWFASQCLGQPTLQGIRHPREAEAERVATAWLELLDAGNATDAFDQLTDIFKGNLTPEIWKTTNEESRRNLGQLISRTFRRVVIYEDPQNAPLPGTYAAVEYDSAYQNADKHSDYVVLHSQHNEPFKVTRHESTFVLNQPPEDPDAH